MVHDITYSYKILGLTSKQIQTGLSRFLNQNELSNIVIVLAGTNDCILRKENSRDIADTIIKIHDDVKRRMKSVRLSPAHTIAVTIPMFDGAGNDRIEINRLIREYVVQHSHETWLYEMENFSIPAVKYRDLWSPDYLHFTAKGYDKMGFELYEVIKRHFGRTDESHEKPNILRKYK